MNKIRIALMLCLLLLNAAPSQVSAQPASAPGTNTFTGSASVPDQVTFTITGSMSQGRDLATATLLNDGRVLVAGGDTWPSPPCQCRAV